MRLTAILLCLVGLMTASPAQSLTILCENDPPAQFLDADGELTGYTVALVREIQKRVGNSDEINMVPWARGYEMIKQGPDVVLFMMARTAQRNDLFHWVGPVLEFTFGFYARSDSKLTLASLEDARKVKSIGVYFNDVRDQMLTRAGFENLDRVRSNLLNVKKLMAGRIDLYVASSISYGIDAIEAGFKPTDLKPILSFQTIQTYIAMSKDISPDVVQAWNEALGAMRDDGSFERLLKRYYPSGKLPGPAITTFNDFNG